MTKQEMTTLLRSVCVNENTITAMENAYEMGVEAEREACAKVFDKRNTGTGFYEPHEPAEIIRARGEA